VDVWSPSFGLAALVFKVSFGKAFGLLHSIASERVLGEVTEMKFARIVLIVIDLATLVRASMLGATIVMYGVVDPA
jgi:hypothetical protein